MFLFFSEVHTFKGTEVSNDRHDSFTCDGFDFVSQEGADIGQLVEDRQRDVSTQDPCGCCGLFFHKRGCNSKMLF